MGATSFEHTIYTDSAMDAAYAQAVSEARDEYGHDPYNGTVSTTEGVQLSPLYKGSPIPENQIDQEALSARLNDLSKWGPCEALPILRVQPARTIAHGHITVEVSVPSHLLTGDQRHYNADLHKALKDGLSKEVRKRIRSDKQLTLDPDNRGESKVLATGSAVDDYTVSYMVHQIAQVPKVATRATKGKTETRYFVLPEGAASMPTWDSGFPSQAEARAALPTSLPSSRGWDQNPKATYEVISMTRRVGGEPLVTHVLDAASAKTTLVKVCGSICEVIDPEQVTREKGWLLYGVAAC